MDQVSRSRHPSSTQRIPVSASGHFQNEHPSQDGFPLYPDAPHTVGVPADIGSWALSDSEALGNVQSTSSRSPEMQMLSFSLSQQLLPSTAGANDILYPTRADYPVVPNVSGHNDLDLAPSQDFHQYSSMVDLDVFDNDPCTQNGSLSYTSDDTPSVSHSSHTDDSQLITAHGAWSPVMTDIDNFHKPGLDQLTTSMLGRVSPSLTEALPASSYPHIPGDTSMRSMRRGAPVHQAINLEGRPFPLTPPLTEKDGTRYDPHVYPSTHLTVYSSKEPSSRPSIPAGPICKLQQRRK